MAVGKLNGHLGARQIDAGGFAGVAVLVHNGTAVHGEVVQLLVISGQGHVACGHFKGKFFAGLPVLRRVHKRCAAGKLPAAEQVMFVRPRLRHGDFIACQRTAAFHAIYKDGAFSVVHRHIVNRFVLGFQGHVACGHLKGEFFAVLPAALRPASRRCFGFGICRLPLLELLGNIVAVGKLNGHLGARQIDAGGFAGVAVLVHNGTAVHGEVVQLLVISFQAHVACGHGEGEFFAVFPVIRRAHKRRAAGKLPAIKFTVRIEEGVRRFHRDGLTFQRPAALLVVYENRAAAISHRHIVNRFALGFQCHVACRHGKAKARLALPIIGQVCGFRAAERPLLELILDTRAPGKRNGHLGARQIVAGVAVSAHDGAAGNGEVVQLLVISGQGHVAFGHFKGKFFAVLPAIGQARGLRAAERPLLELLRIRVLRGRNGHHFTGIEAGIADAICLGGDTFRLGMEGVKGGGFDAEIRRIRRIFITRVTCVLLFRIACRGGIINTAHVRWRRIGDVLCRLAAGVIIDDLHLIGIFNGRTAGNDRRRSLASCYGHTGAAVDIQSAAHGNATIIADVHCAAAGNVGLITDSILLCVANNGHTGAAVDDQLALNRTAAFILNAYVSARRNGGRAFDSSIIVARHSDGTTGGHSQPSAHRRAA